MKPLRNKIAFFVGILFLLPTYVFPSFLSRSSANISSEERNILSAPHILGEVIVKLKATELSVSDISSFHKLKIKKHIGGRFHVVPNSITGWRRQKFGTNRLFVLELDDKSDEHLLRVIEELKNDPRISYAEPNYSATIPERSRPVLFTEVSHQNRQQEDPACNPPNDTFYDRLWGIRDIGADAYWCSMGTSSSVVIASIDTGVDYTHPDLAPNIWVNPGEDIDGDGIITDVDRNGVDDDMNGIIDDFHGFNAIDGDGEPGDPMDGDDHGSHTAGILGAVGNNELGVTGVNWHLPIMAVRFLNPGGSYADAAESIQYVNMMADKYNLRVVMSNSWGGPGFSRAVYDSIASARDAGHLFVAAAGNRTSATLCYPARFFRDTENLPGLDNVLPVGASNSFGNRAYFSNYGFILFAPGMGILSTIRNNQYALWDGTSMAQPYASGAAALLMQHFPEYTYKDTIDFLFEWGSLMVIDRLEKPGVKLNLFNFFEEDTIPPLAITDLTIVKRSQQSIFLKWTAPDDAMFYDIRYSADAPITEETFDQALQAKGINPQSAGSTEQLRVRGLDENTQYWFAIKTWDNKRNISPLSNVVFANTLKGVTIFFDDCEKPGDSIWVRQGSLNGKGEFIWHQSTKWGNNSPSPVTAWYYGNQETGTVDFSYDTHGEIFSRNSIYLYGYGDITLELVHRIDMLAAQTYNRGVIVVIDDYANEYKLWEGSTTEGEWEHLRLIVPDLVAESGMMLIRFFVFAEASEEGSNQGMGWYIDNITVKGSPRQ